MKTISQLWCSVRIPTSKKVTAIQLLAERVHRWGYCFKKTFTPIVSLSLDPERCQTLSTNENGFSECQVILHEEAIQHLDADTFVKIKVKKGRKTLRKKIFKTRYLIRCLQEVINGEGNLHLSVIIASFSPLDFLLKIKPVTAARDMEADEVQTSQGELIPSVHETTDDEHSQAQQAEGNTTLHQPVSAVLEPPVCVAGE